MTAPSGVRPPPLAVAPWASLAPDARPCEVEGCAVHSSVRAFVQRTTAFGPVTDFSLKVCEGHGRFLSVAGHHVPGLAWRPRPEMAQRGVRTLLDDLLIAAMDAGAEGVDFAAWCESHAVPPGLRRPGTFPGDTYEVTPGRVALRDEDAAARDPRTDPRVGDAKTIGYGDGVRTVTATVVDEGPDSVTVELDDGYTYAWTLDQWANDREGTARWAVGGAL